MSYIQAYVDFIKRHNLIADNCQMALAGRFEEYLAYFNNTACEGWVGKMTFKIACQMPTKRGMYIWGGVGRGKSMMTDLFFDMVKPNIKMRMHFHDFMAYTHKELDKLRKSSDFEDHVQLYAENFAKKYHLVVLDELQVTNVVDAMIVGRLFSWLLKAGVYIFFSSNRVPEDLFKDGLQREGFLPFIELVNNKLEVFNLDNATDYRLCNAQLARSYMHPINEENDKSLDSFINEITGGHTLVEERILVDTNRFITVFQTYGHVGIFTFKELCEVNFGAMDYIALCKRFKVMVIKSIPRLKPENHNELLRFITLIDCMYEAGTMLVCTAETEIDEIYKSGQHSFEFQRTLSRLRAMHSKEYINGDKEVVSALAHS